MRHVVLHYHLFKNAGSTIDSILEKKSGGSFGQIEGDNPWDTLGPDSVLQFARENENLLAITSHQARLPVPADPGIRFHPIIFLRHPIDRVGSVYAYERRQPDTSEVLGHKMARENNIKDYVKWRLREKRGALIENFHVIHLASRERDMRTAVATAEDLDVARARLKKLDFFGIVELFEESLQRLQKYLAPDFGDLDIQYKVKNKSNERNETLDGRLQDLKIQLGKDLYNELLDKNAKDIEFYKFALNIFSRKTGTMFGNICNILNLGDNEKINNLKDSFKVDILNHKQNI